MLCYDCFLRTVQETLNDSNLTRTTRKLAYNFHLNSAKNYFEKEKKCFLSEFTFDRTTNVDKGIRKATTTVTGNATRIQQPI